MEENGNLVRFIFNQNREVVAEEDASGLNRLIRGTELIASRSSADSARTYYHYASDEMGSTTHIVDEAGAVLNRYEYDAWGNIIAQEEAIPNRFKFTGQQLDPVTQQYYLRARFYNPVVARFTQEDTHRGDGLNLYAYCDNNPVFYVDPTGHVPQCLKNAFDKYRLQGEDPKTALDLARKDYEAAQLRGETIPAPEKPSNAGFKEYVRRETEFIQTNNEVQAVMQQYQATLDRIDPTVSKFPPWIHGTRVHKKVSDAMKTWAATQNFQHINVETEVSFYDGDKNVYTAGHSRLDLLITEKARDVYYIGDIKTGKATYGKTQMAKSQGNVVGGSTTSQSPLPNVSHWQFKPGETPQQVFF